MKHLKYQNHKVTYQGLEFDSRAEMQRYIELKCRLIRGEIAGLHRQWRFMIIPKVNGHRIKHLKTKDKTITYCVEKPAYYTCDFIYLERYRREILGGVRYDWRTVIEDCKSTYTRSLKDYVLRRKLMVYAIHHLAYKKSQTNRGARLPSRDVVFRESTPQSGNKPTKIMDR